MTQSRRFLVASAAVVIATAISSSHVDAFVTPQRATMRARPLSVDLRFFQEEKTPSAAAEDKEVSKLPTLATNKKMFDPFRISGNGAEDLDVSSLKSKIGTGEPEGVTTPPNDEDNEPVIGLWAARGLLLLIAVIWGTNFASVKYLETLCFHPPCVHPPSEAALARFGLAAAVSIPLLVGQRRDIILAGLECGLWISLGYISQAAALSTISAGTCAFICSLTVVVVPLLSALLYGKPIKPMNLAAAAVALTGVGILEGLVDVNAVLGIKPAGAIEATTVAASAVASSSIETAAVATGPLASVARSLGVNSGDLIALGQPFGFGFAFIQIENYVEKFKGVKNRVLTLSAAQCVAVGFVSLLWVLHDFNGVIPNMEYMLDPHRLAAIGWTGMVTTVFAIYLEGIALQTATATDAALTFSSEPVWASLFGVWLLNERLDSNSYAGGAIILLACVIGALSDFSSEEESEASAE